MFYDSFVYSPMYFWKNEQRFGKSELRYFMHFKYDIKFSLWNIGFKRTCAAESKCMAIHSTHIHESRQHNDDVFIILILLKIASHVHDQRA